MNPGDARKCLASLEALDRAAGWLARDAVASAVAECIVTPFIYCDGIPYAIPMTAVRRQFAARGIALGQAYDHGYDVGGFFMICDKDIIQQAIEERSGRN